MPAVDPADVVALTESDDRQAVAELAVPLLTELARAYTRGNGFAGNGEPNAEIAAVITTASARFLGNPTQTSSAETVGPFTRDVRTWFTGWTLAEQFVLNRYRVRAM